MIFGDTALYGLLWIVFIGQLLFNWEIIENSVKEMT